MRRHGRAARNVEVQVDGDDVARAERTANGHRNGIEQLPR
jgi:hypothetical protein